MRNFTEDAGYKINIQNSTEFFSYSKESNSLDINLP